MIYRRLSLALSCAFILSLPLPALASQGSGCMPTTGTVSGLTFTQNVNAAIAAITSAFSGASAPATDCTAAPVKGQTWLDTSVTPNVVKQYDGTSWVVVGAIDATNHLWSPPIGGGVASVTAAPATDICAAPAALQTITGTTPITSFGSACVVGVTKKLRFSSATPITYNATSMILPGLRSFVASPGDMADATYLGAGNWQISSITKADGSSVTNPAVPMATVLFGDFATLPPKTVVGVGQAIARTSYPDYLAAVTRSQTGVLTAGNNTITGVANIRGFGVGMPIEGTGIPAGTTVASAVGTSIVMSATATANGSQTVTVFLTGYGQGGDSTTVGVKNCVGRTMAGLDPTTTVLSSATAINSLQGSKEVTLTAAQIPAHSHPNTLSDPGHSHSQYGPSAFQVPSGANGPIAGNYWAGSPQYSLATQVANTGITINNANNVGGGAPHSIVQPTAIAECVVVVLP